MADRIRVLALSGSLRKKSFNTALLRAAVELAPPELDIDVSDDLRDLPLYDDDLKEKGFPGPVARFREKLEKASAVLIVSPEYNYSLPGGLKNAIDWASRPPNQPFAGKPLAIMGASPGISGTMRMQYHLRQVAVFLDMIVVNKPEVFVQNCAERFDADLKLTDERTRKNVKLLLENLRDLTQRLQRGSATT